MPSLGAVVDSSSPHAAETSESFARYARVTSPDQEGMVLDALKIRLPPNSAARVGLYVGGTSNADPAGATLIFEGLATNSTGSAAVVTVTAAQEEIPANARLWFAHKGTNEDRYYVYTVGDPHPGDGPDTEAGDLLSAAWDWGPNASINTDTSSPWPSTLTTSEPSGGSAVMMALEYSVGGGPTPSVISDPTPSGTIGTANTATVGCTTDTEEGTLYAVLSETNNVSTATGSQIKAGQNSTSAAADFADDAAVTDSAPEVAFSGLDPETTYYYALVQETTEGFSNVLSGSFTTADAPITAAYIRETLIDKLGDPVVSVTGITMAVYHAVPTEAAPNPHEVIEDVATDSEGEIEVEIDLGDLEEGDPVWIALFKDGGTPAGTLKKVTPEYE